MEKSILLSEGRKKRRILKKLGVGLGVLAATAAAGVFILNSDIGNRITPYQRTLPEEESTRAQREGSDLLKKHQFIADTTEHYRFTARISEDARVTWGFWPPETPGHLARGEGTLASNVREVREGLGLQIHREVGTADIELSAPETYIRARNEKGLYLFWNREGNVFERVVTNEGTDMHEAFHFEGNTHLDALIGFDGCYIGKFLEHGSYPASVARSLTQSPRLRKEDVDGELHYVINLFREYPDIMILETFSFRADDVSFPVKRIATQIGIEREYCTVAGKPFVQYSEITRRWEYRQATGEKGSE